MRARFGHNHRFRSPVRTHPAFFRESRVVIFLLVFHRLCRRSALSLCLANYFEESHWHKTSRCWDGGITSLVPVRVVLPTEYVEKVAFVEGKLVRMMRLGFVVVQRLDDLGGVN